MTLDQIEELIRKYLAMGVTVVVILTGVQPGTGVFAVPSSAPSSATASAARPPIVVSGAATATPRPSRTAAPGTGTSGTGTSDSTGAPGSDPGRSDGTDGSDGAPTTATTDHSDGDWRAADTGAVGGTPAAPATGGAAAGGERVDGAAAGSGSAGSGSAGSGSAGSAGEGSAAAKFGWGTPDRVEDFSAGTGAWDLYAGPGHDGKGTRSPSAVSIADGVMTITGSPDGTTEGMAWAPGRKFGRWEARVRSPAGDSSYHAVLLLWPDAENWPAGGEVDFMEISDETRQTADMFLHYGADNSQKSGSVAIDATQWHDWAVEWTPQGITAYVDGTRWWSTTDTSILPPGPMHMTIQLDWFPEGGAVKQTQMSVDWVRRYPVGA